MILDAILTERLGKKFDKFRPKKNSKKLAIVKSLSWRIIGSLDTMFISYILTGSFTMAMSISGVELVTKMSLYYLHERTWDKISK